MEGIIDQLHLLNKLPFQMKDFLYISQKKRNRVYLLETHETGNTTFEKTVLPDVIGGRRDGLSSKATGRDRPVGYTDTFSFEKAMKIIP